jgi:tetratricopeptide (TPR) repeat protein
VSLGRAGTAPALAALLKITDPLPRADLRDHVIGHLVRGNRDAEVPAIIATAPTNTDERLAARYAYVTHLLAAGRLDDAVREAEGMKREHVNFDDPLPLTFSRLAEALARAGRRDDAEAALRFAASREPNLTTELPHDMYDAARASALAALGHYREARLVAHGIENDDVQWRAWFGILEAYAAQKNNT